MHMPNAVLTELVQAGQAYVEGSLLVNGADPGDMLDVAGSTLTITLAMSTRRRSSRLIP